MNYTQSKGLKWKFATTQISLIVQYIKVGENEEGVGAYITWPGAWVAVTGLLSK